MANVKTNQQFSLNLSDLWRGLLIAVLTAVFTTVLDQIQTVGLELNWKQIGVIALTAGLSYILKNFLTPTEIVVNNAPQQLVSAVKQGEPVKIAGASIGKNKSTV